MYLEVLESFISSAARCELLEEVGFSQCQVDYFRPSDSRGKYLNTTNNHWSRSQFKSRKIHH